MTNILFLRESNQAYIINTFDMDAMMIPYTIYIYALDLNYE